MAGTSGGDWAFGLMGWETYRRAGLTFAMRYIVPQIAGKMITRQEITAAHAQDVDLGFVYETTGVSWTGGAEAGLLDGTAARLALMSIGAPESCAAYFTVDSMVPPDALDIAMAYIGAARQNVRPYRCGVYGQYSVIAEAWRRLPDVYRWQTMAWSDGQQSHGADILQGVVTRLAGIEIDLDVAYQPHFGQWYADPARQPSNPGGSIMPYGQVSPESVVSVPVIAGSASKIVLYCDIGLLGQEHQAVRVAVHSEAEGYSQIEMVTLSDNRPHVLVFTARDVDGVSLCRQSESGDDLIGFNIG